MKFTIKIMLILIIISLYNNLNSQNFCGSSFNNLDPILDFEQIENLKRLEEITANFRKEKQTFRTEDIYIIPIVFHIVMENPNSISNEKVQSQLNRLNEDFRALNPDLLNVPTNFIDKIGDTRIQFRLSNLGPNCDGIIRKTTSIACFDWESDEIKFDSEGGSNVIDPEHVLNFWVGNICPTNQGNFNGYAQFPGGNWQTDGVVVIPEVFGHTPAGFNTILGRTGAHEVGHYFNLRHIWGDDALQINNCLGTDFCDDTPNQALPNYSCPSFPHISCNNGPNGDMFFNYMDLTSDLCKIMFTKDQGIRMETALLNDRLGLLISGPFEVCCEIKNQSPILNSSYYKNECGTNSIDLSQFVIGSAPNFSNVLWSTDNNPVDGVSPVLNEIVNESGTYYAYYYVEEANCFGNPSTELEIVIFDLAPDDDIVLPNITFNSNQIFKSNLIIENNITVILETAIFKFIENKGIVVKRGGHLIIKSSTIDACDPLQSWAGIKIESGGFLDTDNAILHNATNGIVAKSNSTLNIVNLEIRGKNNSSGVGLKFVGKVNVDAIKYLNIYDYNIGVQALNGNTVYEFNYGYIANATTGFSSTGSSLIINNYGIESIQNGVQLIAAPGSMITDSYIGYTKQGIWAILSPLTKIEKNIITNWGNLYGNFAVSILLSVDCVIQDNPDLLSSSSTLSIWGSNNVTIKGNQIQSLMNDNVQLAGGPVNLIYGNGHYVLDNYIYGINSEFGISTSSIGGTEIKNNYIEASGFNYNSRTAAIKSLGSMDEEINENIVQSISQATGILAQNTEGNHYFCNQISSTDVGLGILYNSEMQDIIANSLDALAYDLVIRSEIGPQAEFNSSGNPIKNNGNLFLEGNALADEMELTVDQIFNSRFPINPIYDFHKPDNPTPEEGWFVPNSLTAYAGCDDVIGPGWFIFGNDPTKICQYWTWLKSIKNSKPEQFFVKLFHLLKYANVKSGFNLPNCIKTDAVYQALCGVTKLVDINYELSILSEHTINTGEVDSLQTEYQKESTVEGKTAIKTQMATVMEVLYADFETEAVDDSVRLDNLDTELDSIDCTEVIISKWIGILKQYIKFIRTGVVDENDKSALISYSGDCSDLYGDAIHLARALTNTFDSTYYDVNDDCLNLEEPRLSTEEEIDEISISPNPTLGKIYITLPEGFSGSIYVYDVTGNQILSKATSKGNLSTIDISDRNSGLYLVKIVSLNGEEKVFKTILVK